MYLLRKPVKIRLGNACRGRWRALHRAPMVVAPPQYIRATPVITRVHQIDQPLAGRLLNGSLSGQSLDLERLEALQTSVVRRFRCLMAQSIALGPPVPTAAAGSSHDFLYFLQAPRSVKSLVP